MSRWMSWLIAVGIVAGAVVVTVVMVTSRPEPARRDPPPAIPFAMTEAVVIGEGAIPVQGSGTVRPSARIDVAPGVGGFVDYVSPAFRSGGRIAAGETLFRLDDALYRHRVERARAGVAVHEVELLRTREEARIAEGQYESFRNRAGGDAPDAGALALWEPQIKAAEAAVERERAALAEAELDLALTEVVAPFDSVVSSASVDIGRLVAAGERVGVLHAAGSVEVVVPLSDQAAALLPRLWGLRAGTADRRIRARVVADYGGSRHTWTGWVDRAETTLDEATRTIDVVVHVPNPFPNDGPPLLVGKFVDVELEGVTPDAYFRIRRAALRPGDEVWVVDDGRLRMVPVRVLERLEDDLLVTGELTAGQMLVVGGVEAGVEGMAVRSGGEGDR